MLLQREQCWQGAGCYLRVVQIHFFAADWRFFFKGQIGQSAGRLLRSGCVICLAVGHRRPRREQLSSACAYSKSRSDQRSSLKTKGCKDSMKALATWIEITVCRRGDIVCIARKSYSRPFQKELPASLSEARTLDGCSSWNLLRVLCCCGP